jgi:hypothetical protein
MKKMSLIMIALFIIVGCSSSSKKKEVREVKEAKTEVLQVQNVLIYKNVNAEGFDKFFEGYTKYSPTELYATEVFSCISLGFDKDFSKNVADIQTDTYKKYANEKLLKCLEMDFSKSIFSGTITKYMSFVK